jgi:hypothetical protein
MQTVPLGSSLMRAKRVDVWYEAVNGVNRLSPPQLTPSVLSLFASFSLIA